VAINDDAPVDDFFEERAHRVKAALTAMMGMAVM